MLKSFYAAAIALFLCVSPSLGAIQGFSTLLAASNYTVPAGKILVLQAVGPGFSNPANNILSIYPTGSGTPYNLYINVSNTNGLYKLPISLKLPAGAAIGGSGQAIFGLLVDPQDLYVGRGLTSHFDNVASSGGVFSSDLLLASAAPAQVRIQSSPDLKNWANDSTVTVQPTSTKTTLKVTANEKAASQYYRAVVSR